VDERRAAQLFISATPTQEHVGRGGEENDNHQHQPDHAEAAVCLPLLDLEGKVLVDDRRRRRELHWRSFLLLLLLLHLLVGGERHLVARAVSVLEEERRVQRAQAAVGEDGDGVAEGVGFLHRVGGEDDDAAGAGGLEPLEHVPDVAVVDGSINSNCHSDCEQCIGNGKSGTAARETLAIIC
jgi:hypothetical protein